MLRRLRLVFFAMVCVVLTGGVSAEQPIAEAASEPTVSDAAPDAAPTPTVERSVASMQMWIDPETGAQRVPTHEEAARLSAAVQRMFAAEKAAPRVRTDKSGMMSVALDASMLEFSVVRVEADGTLSRHCVDDAEQALELISRAPTPQTEQEEE